MPCALRAAYQKQDWEVTRVLLYREILGALWLFNLDGWKSQGQSAGAWCQTRGAAAERRAEAKSHQGAGGL